MVTSFPLISDFGICLPYNRPKKKLKIDFQFGVVILVGNFASDGVGRPGPGITVMTKFS